MATNKKITGLEFVASLANDDLLTVIDIDGGSGGVPINRKITWQNLSGAVAPLNATFVTMTANALLPNERILTGTANQVIVTDGGAGGNVTLSTPQDIAVGSSPTFAGLTLSGLTASRLLASNGANALVSSDLFGWVAGTANRVIVADDGDGTITLSSPQDIALASSPTFAGLTINGNISVTGTVDGVDIAGIADAQYVVIAADADLVNERILAGTVNQVTVTDGGAGGNVTLSLPQDIHTSAVPEFDGMTISSINGIDYNPGADIDTDLITVGVTGSPKIWWDESEDGFAVTKRLDVTTERTDTAGNAVTFYSELTANPGGATSANYYGFWPVVKYTSAQACTGVMSGNLVQVIHDAGGTLDTMAGMWTNVSVSNTETPTIDNMRGYVLNVLDAEDAAVGFASSLYFKMASVDTGSITHSYGLNLISGVIGAGSITNQYGIKIGDISGATTLNYSIFTAAGLVSFGDDLKFRQASTISTSSGAITINPANGITNFGASADHDQTIHINTDNASYYMDIKLASTNNAFVIEMAGVPILNTYGYFDADEMGLGVKDYEDQLYIDTSGNIGIGITSGIVGQLHIDQSSSSGAQPVLFLDQGDVSEEMMQFETTIGVGNAIEAIGAKTLTTTHFVKVTIPGGLTRYFPVGTIA